MKYWIKLLIISIASIVAILIIGEYVNDNYDWPEDVKILSKFIVYHKLFFILITYFIIKSNSFFKDLFGLFFVQFLTLIFHFVFYQINEIEDVGFKIIIFSILIPFFILIVIYVLKNFIFYLKNWYKMKNINT